jgi:multidrug efflux pump subunit AcrB
MVRWGRRWQVIAVVGLHTNETQGSSKLSSLVIKTTLNGAPIRVADVAAVQPATMPVYTMVTSNGNPAVLLNIARQPLSNTVKVADAIAHEIAHLQTRLPAELIWFRFMISPNSSGSNRQCSRRDPYWSEFGMH